MRLGQTGYIRFQRFAEIIYTPVVPSPSDSDDEEYRFFPEVEADLIVDGVDWGLVDREAAGADPDPHFESTYRSAFLNYEEGRRFRTRRGLRNPDFAEDESLSRLGGGPGQTAVPPITSPFAGATTPVYRVVISSPGIHRLSHSYLSSNAPGLLGVDPRTLKMLNKGVEVPIRVVGESDGVFNTADYMEFYGEGLLDEPPLLVNYEIIGGNDIMQVNDFTDENIYHVFGEAGTHARIPDLSGTFNPVPPAADAFDETIHREFDTRWFPDGFNPPYVQNPFLGENGGSFVPDPNAADCGYLNASGVHTLATRLGPSTTSGNVACAACDLNLVDLDPNSSGDTATVRVRMRGASSEAGVAPDHMTVAQVGEVPAQSSTLCWDGAGIAEQTVGVPQSALSSGEGVYVGQPGLDATMDDEFLFLDWLEVDYKRRLRLAGAALVRAGYTNVDRTYTMSGFPTSTAADMVVYDISRKVASSSVPSPRRVTGGTVGGSGGDFTLRFTLSLDASLDPNDERVLAGAGAGGFMTPDRIEEATGPNLVDTTNEADMLVITHPDVVGDPPTSTFTSYIAHRESVSGLNLQVVMIRDVYDYFSNGLETPEAFRTFLAYAVDNWKGLSGTAAPPSYVMLVGDVSLDFKDNISDVDWINHVPTFLLLQNNPVIDYYASDTYISAFIGGDQLPDIHLGRISVRNPSQVDTVFDKMMDYDVSPPPGSWRSHGAILSDRGKNPAETVDFESQQTALWNTYFQPPYTGELLFYDDPNYMNGTFVPAWRDDFVQVADGGASLTSYLGHGAFNDWGLDGLWTRTEMSLLSSTQKPTFLVNENCLVAGFHALGGDSLGEAFQKAAGKGAVAVFGPAGLSLASVGSTINNALFPEMFGLGKERRFGNLMTNVKLALGSAVLDMQAYVLLGDPAQKYILPAPAPPENFASVTGLDAQVDLSWTPSPDPGVKTRIYRRTVIDPAYALITPSGGVTGTAFTDSSVVNGQSYFYRATSVDPNGVFEGAVTNFNGDCAIFNPPASGPDCVWAIPVNPNAPAAPANFRVTNPGLGNQLNVSWDLPPDPDLMKITVHFGTADGGPYPMSVDFAPALTQGAVKGLTMGTTYHLVASATNTSNLTSVTTSQISAIPTLFEGINPPGFIDDLELRRSLSDPNSIELLWTPPAMDITGGLTDLSSFSIYRDTFPSFTPSVANRIAEINDPLASSYTDPGAFVAPSNYFYLIGATDSSGAVSGIGYQLPGGIPDLQVVRMGGSLVFTWSPVSADVDGNPTPVSHYALYEETTPIEREQIDMLTPVLPVINGTSTSVAIPPGDFVYYSVIVVDTRGNKSPF